MTTPEGKARENIDGQLEAAGWKVQDRDRMNLSAATGVAVREFPLKSGYADYMLYLDGRAAGVVEAKPEGQTLSGVETQSQKYTEHLPDEIPHYHLPLPFSYESTGRETYFTNQLDPSPRSRRVFTFHRPEDLLRMVRLGESQLRANLQHMPPLQTGGLWPVQVEAIENLEQSLANNRPRTLIQMATGSGKTFTACNFCYRLIKHARAKRILFLVDRNNLGKQTLNEFQQFDTPGTQYSFTEEYNVQRLQSNKIDPTSKVTITTIQRLYSILQGEESFDAQNEEESTFEAANALRKEPAPVEYNPEVPIETFDFIIVDECHRSIYNLWRQVLDYFDAFLIGLTATPTAQTIGFFNGNLVQDYSHEKAVADNVNVGYEVYRIRTKIGEDGSTIRGESGLYLPRRDRRTRAQRLAELDDDLIYTSNQLDRDIVSEDHMRLVIRTFRDKLSDDIFPRRTTVPKTLLFAKNDNHAEDLVRIIREEFGKDNEFCRKITSKSQDDKPDNLLNQFRNSYNPRIAVTVDMIATGTDVKPLECLFFMRNINSASYFEQMKGRGVRVIKPDDLQSVTPDVKYKTHFVIVDAVGICEKDKTHSRPLDRQPSVTTDQLLQAAAQGQASADLASTLGSRLAKLDQQLDDETKEQIAEAAGGEDLAGLTRQLFEATDEDVIENKAKEQFDLPENAEPTEDQISQAEFEVARQALRPFHDPQLRDLISQARRRSSEQVIDEISRDELRASEFDAQAKEKAETLVSNFRRFIQENKDQIEALSILYNQPHHTGLRYRQVKELAKALKTPPLSLHDKPAAELWQAFEQTEPDNVRGQGGQALVDLIALVRHAIYPEKPLEPVRLTVHQRYERWLAEKQAQGIIFTDEQRRWLDAIKEHIATSLTIETEDFEDVPFSQHGGLGKVYQLFGEQLNTLLEELNEELAA
jgi:type I restriction enzyme R subunit